MGAAGEEGSRGGGRRDLNKCGTRRHQGGGGGGWMEWNGIDGLWSHSGWKEGWKNIGGGVSSKEKSVY